MASQEKKAIWEADRLQRRRLELIQDGPLRPTRLTDEAWDEIPEDEQ